MKALVFISFFLSVVSLGSPLATLKGIGGKEVSLDHKKPKELVMIWATWCPDCKKKLKAELPKLNERNDVAVITVNTDRSERRAQNYIDSTGLKLPVLRDPDRKYRKQLKAFSVPFWAVYERAKDGSRKLIDSNSGYEQERVYRALGILGGVG